MTALELITSHYGSRTAERSKVPLIRHIHEGLAVLDGMGATQVTKDAFCVHPLFQNNSDLRQSYRARVHRWLSPDVVLLIMEYRNQANSWLSDKVASVNGICVSSGKPSPGPLTEVRNMLVADKVQNCKDFRVHHPDHPRFAELCHYFQEWFTVLAVNDFDYKHFCRLMEKVK